MDFGRVGSGKRCGGAAQFGSAVSVAAVAVKQVGELQHGVSLDHRRHISLVVDNHSEIFGGQTVVLSEDFTREIAASQNILRLKVSAGGGSLIATLGLGEVFRKTVAGLVGLRHYQAALGVIVVGRKLHIFHRLLHIGSSSDPLTVTHRHKRLDSPLQQAVRFQVNLLVGK